MSRCLLTLFLTLLLFPQVHAVSAPAYNINAVAGDGRQGFTGDGGQAGLARLASPSSVAVDAVGNVYVADKYNHRIRKISPQGDISTLAGTGKAGYSGDGKPAEQAQLNTPLGVAVDAQGQVYVADSENHAVRYIDRAGVMRTLAGRGSKGSVGDGGAATQAYFRQPSGVAVDQRGVVYIADTGNAYVRKVTPDGIVQAFAGTKRKKGFSGDGGSATQATLNHPVDVAVDGLGNVLIADKGNQRVRKVDSQGLISTLAGGNSTGFTADGSEAQRARLFQPSSVAADAQGRVFIADSYNHRIRMVDIQGIIHTIAGSGLTDIGNGAYAGEGILAGRARLFNPQGVAVDAQGQIFIADTRNQRVRKLTPAVQAVALIDTFAGAQATGLSAGGFSGDGGTANAARMKQPRGLAFDTAGQLYIADTRNHRIRVVTPEGVMKTLAGQGKAGFKDADDPLQAQFNAPSAIVVDAQNNIFVSDTSNHRVRKIDPQGRVTTLVGTGKTGGLGDGGAATQAQLFNPRGLALGTDGSLYIADQSHHRVRKVDPQGIISTLAGVGKAGHGGEGGFATRAGLKNPTAVAVNAAGDVYIADRKNYRLLKVDTQGMIHTVAGMGRPGYGDDGVALKVRVDEPNSLAFAANGDLYFTERATDRLRKLTPQGDIISVAGTGGLGFSGDGDPALTAQMYAPAGVAIHPLTSDIFISDTYNHRVRRVHLPSFKLHLQVVGEGRVTLTAAGYSEHTCQASCEWTYAPDTAVQLQAKPDSDFELKGWSLCASSASDRISVSLSTDSRCQVTFTRKPPPPAPIEPETPPTPPTTPEAPTEPEVPEEPEEPEEPEAVVEQALPALTSRKNCIGVEQALSLDLHTEVQKTAVLEQINALPVFKNSDLSSYQDAQQGYLVLEQGPLRLSVQPIVARFSNQALNDLNNALQLGTQQETLLRLPQSDGTVLDVFAQPAVQDICALQQQLASLGYAQIQVQNDGNLRIISREKDAPWLSLRPDWMGTQIAPDMPEGVMFSGTLFDNGYPSIALTFTDEQGQKRRQFFYTAPADLEAIQSAVQDLSIPSFAAWSFTWQGQAYQGVWHQQVRSGEAGGEFKIQVAADINGDGVEDYRVSYPNGEQQFFFAHKEAVAQP